MPETRHHDLNRLLAGLLAGAFERVCHVPYRALDARVNGCRADSIDAEERWVPLEVARASSLDPADWREVPEREGAKGPTAGIPGRICSLDEVFAERHRGVPLRELVREL